MARLRRVDKYTENLPPIETLKLRKSLSAPGLLNIIRDSFASLKEHRKGNISHSLVDSLMSGLAVFGFKSSSLLKFEEAMNQETTRGNLKSLYGVRDAPSDTQLRVILDPVKPARLRPAFIKIHQQLQRQKVMDPYRFLGGHLLLVDGTGIFSSNKINCSECCVKGKKNPQYYHQLLAGVIAHPDKKQVFPLFPEAITWQDGAKKNDCERNAGKRLFPEIRAAFPQRKFIVVEDGLASNGPHINLLKELNFNFILGVKAGDHDALFDDVQSKLQAGEMDEFEELDDSGVSRGYRFVNQLALNKTHPDLLVNYLEHWEIKPGQKETIFSWVTDISLSRDNVVDVARGGRCRWKVENETFNTLKNQEYNLEHNYGHGKKHLATNFANLMLLAFLIDQVQESCCPLFQLARKKFPTRTGLWMRMRIRFEMGIFNNWETLLKHIIYSNARTPIQINSP